MSNTRRRLTAAFAAASIATALGGTALAGTASAKAPDRGPGQGQYCTINASGASTCFNEAEFQIYVAFAQYCSAVGCIFPGTSLPAII